MKKERIIISELDYLVIARVNELRLKKRISQRDLSELMGLSKSFVGKVESLGQPEKYSIRHLTLIAKALKLKSTRELLPTTINENDLIEIEYEKVPKLKKDGMPSKQFDERVTKITKVENTN